MTSLSLSRLVPACLLATGFFLPRLASAEALPASFFEVTAAATKPAYTTMQGSLSAPTPGLASEVRRIASLIAALERTAGTPAGDRARAAIRTEAATCGHLLRRISQLENSKPGNLDTIMAGAGLIGAIAHDSKNSSDVENFKNGVEGAQAIIGLIERISAEIDLSDLRKEYRAAAEALEQKAGLLYTIDEATGGGLPRPGFTGMTIEGNKVVSTVPGSAARSAGIEAGDTIREIDGKSMEGLTTTEVLSHITGNAGQMIKFRFKDAGPKTLELRRMPGYSKIAANYHSSMNGTFYADHLTLTNSTNRNLTNCLIRVRRLDAQRSHCTRLHYCKSWPANGELHFGYRPGSDFAPAEAFDDIESVEISMVSDQLQEEAKVDYSGAAKEADYEQQFKDLTISYSMLEFKEGFFFDDDAGVRISLGGKLTINPSKVRITFSESSDGDPFGGGLGGDSQTIWWEGSNWEPGETKTFRDAKFNNIDASKCRVEIEFPHTTYKAGFSWDLP